MVKVAFNNIIFRDYQFYWLIFGIRLSEISKTLSRKCLNTNGVHVYTSPLAGIELSGDKHWLHR